ncbi:hypothetical protein [Salinimicrobium oceani]|uniref:Uncharacterized protein n=1 Tax=Salinimicrobium oceani TaxID=2722702 RepID=A0ABX1D4G9_9FLAO|nr:hypothetical protein [Salinimicrobium oceani]NJW54129.1 hypothetical protein [Salinimicrobium oceani]
MRRKNIFRFLFLVILIYPIFTLFLTVVELDNNSLVLAKEAVLNYQISIWISWLFMVATAVYFKWTHQQDFFFFFTYAFLVLAFGFLGYLSQKLLSNFDLPNKFEDEYSFGVLQAVQHIITSVVLTAFLQAGVWWFTRRWHRN